MELRHFDRPDGFLMATGEFLHAREADHNLLIGIAGEVARGRRFGEEPPYLVAATDRGRVVGAALRTPPHNLVLSHLDAPGAVDLIAPDVLQRSRPPGLLGPLASCDRFIPAWRRLTGEAARLDRHERIYRLERVRPPPSPDGACRPVAESDRAIVVAWIRAFQRKTGEPEGTDADENFDRRRAGPADRVGMWVWVDGAGSPVSITGYGSPTSHGVRIGPVYTAPAARRRGYASALVAAVSQWLLDGGRRFVYLFTDLANPTSNHVYRSIGYEPVTDFDQYTFLPSGAGGRSAQLS